MAPPRDTRAQESVLCRAVVGPSVSPLGSMLRAQASVGRRLLVAAWRRELGTSCSAVAEIGGQTGVNYK